MRPHEPYPLSARGTDRPWSERAAPPAPAPRSGPCGPTDPTGTASLWVLPGDARCTPRTGVDEP